VMLLGLKNCVRNRVINFGCCLVGMLLVGSGSIVAAVCCALGVDVVVPLLVRAAVSCALVNVFVLLLIVRVDVAAVCDALFKDTFAAVGRALFVVFVLVLGA
jgi:hypothetical protein